MSARERTWAVIGDVHGFLTRLDPLIEHLTGKPLDGVLLVGDFASWAYEKRARRAGHDLAALTAEVEGILERVARVSPHVLWVPGNHDLPELTGTGNCDRRAADLNGLSVYGIGGAGPERFGFPYEWDEEEIAALEVPEVEVLLCHAPPKDTTLDRVPSHGKNVGSAAIRKHAGRARVLVCGHIHESSGVEALGSCLCLNAGSLGQPYGKVQVGYVRKKGEEFSVSHEDLETGRIRELGRSEEGRDR